ncbi:MAG: N-6 DNA methylase [Gemmatimonas sp.]|uniref:N-6 DNA methylase n=1 Tax=Gemmatimonas sp. TaxID=1962908 RepID=UPI0022C7D927|nr:N-6 DNA methylase [Gemmatimonas sp.]MCZ8012399.1 N-6 DNA methylase [Gemmatimonas sp.]MCZ8266672.1 N-6 DNA methylase [Gemmatimonas sp.]
MLDSVTKRRIDTARDILVGKVPDPKSQVEQITIALIYKFMDDMDAESEELGGTRRFFTGDFAKYGWAQLMSPRLGGHEMLGLYGEGIARMSQNPGVPPLFRDIFKNAYLPYRDPETLKAFLKVVGEFTYDHSERLGDAFEYLLSVLGSQGDAGQFRTPRHIIDWIVEVVAPKKGEVILDPACGTAGFLISAYKHIERTSAGADGVSTLTPDDRARMAQNLKGYDISPDMVRLSLANLYLHGFTQPQVHEYDTLTSEDRWNEHADVILANPPFMSPKGGIRPHRRFSIQAKRSEVLFVDYIAEHLAPTGRAGIIVPEGVIFQSQGAYVALRKLLVEQSLVAVVSLPAGVFNPYSGVKTSILILDKAAAKHSTTIGFFKIENDGFSLGAQRREIEANDLPPVRKELAEYLRRLRARESLEGFMPATGHIVPKATIATKGDYNLSGERYSVGEERHSVFPLRRFEDVCTLEYGGSLPKEKRTAGPFPVVGSNGVTGYHNEYLVEGPAIVVGRKGSAGEVTWIPQNCFPIDTTYYVKQTNAEESDLRFLFWILKALGLTELRGGAGVPGLNRADVYDTRKIPLPPLDVQRELVAEIEGYQRVIDGARAVVENYRPRFAISPEWPMVAIGDLCTIERGASPRPIHDFITDAPDGVNWIKIGDAPVGAKYIASTKERVSQAGAEKSRRVFAGDFILSNSMSFGRPYIMATEGCIHDGWLLLRNQSELVDKDYLYHILGSELVYSQFKKAATGGVVNNLNSEIVRSVKIPLPSTELQRSIVAEIDEEQRLVDGAHDLIARFERKIHAALARVWGEDATLSAPT